MRRLSLGFALLLSACSTGDGSDIGPELEDLPEAVFRVLVRNEQDQGVSNALVGISGSAATAGTGQSGRAGFRNQFSGVRSVRVSAATASASPGDQLASLTVSEQLTGKESFPYAVYLPDLSSSLGLPVTAGPQAAPLTLDDSASSGAIFNIPSASVVGLGAAMSGIVQSGSLASAHLPGLLPAPMLGRKLSSRGVFIGPDTLTVSPGGTLSIPNDLNMPASAAVELWRLDGLSGDWVMVGVGSVDPSGTSLSSGPSMVSMGGLYCFATDILSETVVSGRVVSRTGQVLSGALIQTGQAFTKSGSNGRFTLDPIASVDGQGLARTVDIEIHGGARLRPNHTSVTSALPGPSLDLMDVTLDSKRSTNIRVLVVSQGFPEKSRRFRISSFDSPTAAQGILDANGKVVFEDLEFGRFSFTTARIDKQNSELLLDLEGLDLEEDFHDPIDFELFRGNPEWIEDRSGDGAFTRVLDKLGSGIIRGASVYRLRPGADEFLFNIDEFQDTRVKYAVDDFATAAYSSTTDNRTVISAFSSTKVIEGRVELPLERADRLPLGLYGRHGLLGGTLAGRGSGNTLLLRASRSLVIDDWYNQVFDGLEVGGNYPIKLDPGLSGGSDFIAGVALPAGNLTAVEGDTSAGVFTLQRTWQGRNLMAVQGTILPISLGAPNEANTGFRAQDALLGLDPALSFADLTFDLGVLYPDRQVIDIARDIGGNLTAAGTDVDFLLPDLAGTLAGGEYLVALEGSALSSGATVEQQLLIPLSQPTQLSTGFLDVPDILTPAPGASLPLSGFTVQFVIPPGSFYTFVRLRSETSTEVRDWTVLLPDSVDSFDFRPLPSGPDPLAPGNWTIKVTSVRISPDSPINAFIGSNRYQAVMGRVASMTQAAFEAEAFSSSSISVTIN